MTGQIVVEFEGNGVPSITMKGEITSRNMNTLGRFLQKHHRVYKHVMYKASQEAKGERAVEKVVERVLESPEPTPVANPNINLSLLPEDLIEDTDILNGEDEGISEVNDDETETGTIGLTERSGSISGTDEEV